MHYLYTYSAGSLEILMHCFVSDKVRCEVTFLDETDYKLWKQAGKIKSRRFLQYRTSTKNLSNLFGDFIVSIWQSNNLLPISDQSYWFVLCHLLIPCFSSCEKEWIVMWYQRLCKKQIEQKYKTIYVVTGTVQDRGNAILNFLFIWCNNHSDSPNV